MYIGSFRRHRRRSILRGLHSYCNQSTRRIDCTTHEEPYVQFLGECHIHTWDFGRFFVLLYQTWTANKKKWHSLDHTDQLCFTCWYKHNRHKDTQKQIDKKHIDKNKLLRFDDSPLQPILPDFQHETWWKEKERVLGKNENLWLRWQNHGTNNERRRKDSFHLTELYGLKLGNEVKHRRLTPNHHLVLYARCPLK